MRGELFERDEIEDIEELDEIYDEEEIETQKINPYISDKIRMLQEHYTIILEYVKELESRNILLKEKVGRLERELNYEKKTKNHTISNL